MAKYTYPALIKEDPECGYTVEFPDWEPQWTGMTHGRDWDEALYMGNDLLNLMCLITEEDGEKFPEPNHGLVPDKKNYIFFFTADTEYYRKLCTYNKKRRLRWRMIIRMQRKYRRKHVS